MDNYKTKTVKFAKDLIDVMLDVLGDDAGDYLYHAEIHFLHGDTFRGDTIQLSCKEALYGMLTSYKQDGSKEALLGKKLYTAVSNLLGRYDMGFNFGDGTLTFYHQEMARQELHEWNLRRIQELENRKK